MGRHAAAAGGQQREAGLSHQGGPGLLLLSQGLPAQPLGPAPLHRFASPAWPWAFSQQLTDNVSRYGHTQLSSGL